MSDVIGWNVFGVALAVLGIVLAYAAHMKKSPEPPKE